MESLHVHHVHHDDSLRIRAITAFIILCEEDFGSDSRVCLKIEACARILQELQQGLHRLQFTVQTCRIATNSFSEWLIQKETNDGSTCILQQRLDILDEALQKYNISFCSLGPATCVQQIQYIPTILTHSTRFSCSIDVLDPQDIPLCTQAAQLILNLSQFHVETNFRFCVQACCQLTHVPFFPAATTRYTVSTPAQEEFHVRIALGLENGNFFQQFFHSYDKPRNNKEDTVLTDMLSDLRNHLIHTLAPIHRFCHLYHPSFDLNKVHLNYQYLGIDTSLNPSLDRGVDGSVAKALDMLRTRVLSSSSSPSSPAPSSLTPPGTVAMAAQLTQTIQSLSLFSDIQTTGYCGIMLPVCEDTYLATLASNHNLELIQLLAISSVCGVGIDTVPLSGNVSNQALTALILDVVGLAHKWKKPLSCRVFPCPGLLPGDFTQFNSPYLCNCRVLDL